MIAGIPGQHLVGVFSAYHIPENLGKRAAVIGCGNLAVEASRTALRLGYEVYMIYSRLEEELPARLEEVNYAIEEGANFDFLLINPVEIMGDAQDRVKGIKCDKIELKESANNMKIIFSQFILEVDTVILCLGTEINRK